MSADSLKRARGLAEGGDLEGSAQVLAAYLEATPGDASAHFQLAHLVLKLGDTARAVASFQRALEIEPDNAVVNSDLGMALEILGREPEAAEAYRRATLASPPFPPAHYNLALILCRRGRWDEAARHLRAALDQAPEFRVARLQLGRALRRLGQVAPARACFDHLLSGDPKDVEARRAIADMDMSDCRFDAAAQQLEQCLALAPNDGDTILALGACIQELGRIDDALAHYRRLLEHDPCRYYEVVKKLTGASKGRFWVKSAELRRILLG
jgi:tetratricopeptide (TPR) repeat protein